MQHLVCWSPNAYSCWAFFIYFSPLPQKVCHCQALLNLHSQDDDGKGCVIYFVLAWSVTLLLLLWIKNTFFDCSLNGGSWVGFCSRYVFIILSFPFIILFLIFQFAVNGDLGVFYKEFGKTTLLIDWSFNDSLFLSTLAAQPITSKLDESWWAYKDAVQGSFVPGNTHTTYCSNEQVCCYWIRRRASISNVCF